MLQRAASFVEFLASDPVGKAKTGQTPHAVIHRDRQARLRYFAPVGEAKTAPLFISMPLINTWTVFDLLPGRSVVEKLVGAGVPVYLLDWGSAGPEDASMTLHRVIDVTLRRAMDRARRHARLRHGAEELDALGYCVGGTFLSVALSRHPGYARRMALLAAPIDFHKSDRLATWADPESFPLDAIVDNLGNFPGALMKTSFAWLRPSGQTDKWRGLWDRFEQPGFTELWSALESWSDAPTEFPGEAYREYVRSCYFDNALMVGGWYLNGEEVDLSRGTIPALVLAASRDHIAPPAACFGLEHAWGGPVEKRTVVGGHVGVCVGRSLPDALVAWCQEGNR
jgi:polyhydroxyalkanoate synthase